jgi:Tol biopolymer transport system component/DNA-binding winged helix-turn-helix (wHTH) protein
VTPEQVAQETIWDVMLKGASEVYEFGSYRIGVGERVLRRQDQIVPLPPKCFDTLLVLAQHGGNVVEKERLMRAVWPDSFVEEGNLAQNIFVLRKALGEHPGGGQYIQTIPKRGYRLVVPPTPVREAPVLPAVPSVHPIGPASAPLFEPPSSPSSGPSRGPRRISYFIAAGIAVASALGVALWVSSLGERAVTGARITRLTVPNTIAYGIISPDGTHIAYVSPEAAGQSVWVRETGGVGSGLRLAGPLPGHLWGVSYSPNGKYLYYTLEEDLHPTGGTLFRMRAEGGEAEKLMTHVGAAPAFSPDGHRMVFKHYDANDHGYLLTAGELGGDAKIIAQSTASYAFYNYRWAADGKSIYYVEGTRYPGGGSGWSLWELPAAGGQARMVMAPRPQPLRSVNWFSRSEILALIPDEESGAAQVWHLGAGGPARRLTNDINDYLQIDLTADGRTLLANSGETLDSIWTASAPGAGSTEPVVRLPLPAGSYSDPVWTVDGRIVFVGQSNLWLATPDGAERKPLLPERVTAAEPVVSADGRFIVFVLQRPGSRNLWRVGLNGTGLQQVTKGRFDWHPALSQDGKWVAYASYLQGQRALWKAPLDGSGSPVKLVDAGGIDLVFSPDSKLFAYATDLGEIEVRSFGDGSLVRKMTAPADAFQLHWSRDGKDLIYVTHSGRSEEFWGEPIAGGPAVLIGTPLPHDVVTVDWSRDARRIVYLRRELRVDLSLITNLR